MTSAAIRDVRLAVRRLARAPRFFVVAVLTLAVAIAANVAIFSVVSAVLLERLPFRDPDRLVFVAESVAGQPETSLSYVEYREWRSAQRTLDDLAVARVSHHTLTGLGVPERVDVVEASANWFRVVGVDAALGRTFAAEEELAGSQAALLVSDAFWRSRLQSDAGAVGRRLVLDGQSYVVIGVLPKGFHYDRDPPLWITVAAMNPRYRSDRAVRAGLFGVGRLRAGATVAQARDDLAGVARRSPGGGAGDSSIPVVTPLQSKLVAPIRSTLWLLFGAVGFVMLIACANVANLMLARGAARRREMAVRAALGAPRAALVRPLLLEAAVVAVAATAVGVLSAGAAIAAIRAGMRDQLPFATRITMDPSVLIYCVALTVVTALACGGIPALKTADVALAETIKSAGHPGVAQRRLRAALVVFEVALATVLLVGAGLSIRTIRRLESVDLGFRSQGLLKSRLSIPPTSHPDVPSLRAFLREVRQRLGAMPGVESAALSVGLPLSNYSTYGFSVDAGGDANAAALYTISPGYVRTLGAQLLSGRELTDGDGADGEPVCLVDERLAHRFFPDGAVGHSLWLGDASRGAKARIVGVVRHTVDYSLESAAAPFQLFVPLDQARPETLPQLRGVYLTLRGARPEQLLQPARSQLAALDGSVPMAEAMTMQQSLDRSVGNRRIAMWLLGLFGVVALALALVGLYAVMSYLVKQRERELGVRMALGARAGVVQRMVLREGLSLVALGLGLGAVASLGLSRVLAALVFDVSATDPVTYVVVGVLLSACATAALLLPARAATRVDPIVALRAD